MELYRFLFLYLFEKWDFYTNTALLVEVFVLCLLSFSTGSKAALVWPIWRVQETIEQYILYVFAGC